MTIYSGVKITMECNPNALGQASIPWKAEIDAGAIHVHTGKNVTRTVLTAATLSALQTAITTQTNALGIT